MSAGKARRWASRALLGAGAVALVAALVPVRADAVIPAGAPRVFQAESSVSAVDFFPDRNGGITPIAETVHFQFAFGNSRIDSIRGPVSRAGVVNPGNGVTQGPALACGSLLPTIAEQFPAEFQTIFTTFIQSCTQVRWPFVVESDPLTGQSNATLGNVDFGNSSQLLSGKAGGASTRLSDIDSSTDSAINAVRVGPLPGSGPNGLPQPDAIPPLPGSGVDSSVLTVGSVRSTTHSFLTEQTSVSQATATVNGIRLFGGLITIDAVTSTAESIATVDKEGSATANSVVEGVKIAGQAVEIGPDGLSVPGSSTGGPAVIEKFLNDLLKSMGISVRLLSPTTGMDEATKAQSATAAGLLVTVQRDVQLPEELRDPLQPIGGLTGIYFANFYIGSASTRAVSYNIGPGAPPPTTTGGGIDFPTPTFGFTPSTAVVAPPTSAVAAPPTTEQVAGPSLFPPFDNTAERMRFLYLSFTLAGLGVCLAPKFRMPARLPGGAQ